MAEKMVDKISRIMGKPEFIRNICTSAHIDHGKCISPDSRVVFTNGAVLKAEQVFEFAQKYGFKKTEDQEKTIYDVTNLNLKVFSLNKETGEVEKKPIQFAWKLRGGKLIRLNLRNGFSIATTPEHKYTTFEEGCFVEKTAEQIKLNDRIVCVKNTETSPELNVKPFILKKLAEKNIYAKLNKEFGEKLKKIILIKGLEPINKIMSTGLKPKSFYHGSWQNRYLLDDLLSLAAILRLDLNRVYDEIKTISFRKGKRRGKSSNSMKLPTNFKDFFYLAGLFIGDGTNKKFIVGKESLGKKFVRICTDLGIEVTYRNYEGKTPEIVTSATLAQVLNALFDYPLKQKSRNVKVSDFVFAAPKEYSAALVSGYFDCDGRVEKSRRAISLSSASPKMINDLKLLLPRFKIMPSAQKDRIYVSGFSAKEFVNSIGFGLADKMQKARALASTATGSHVSDLRQNQVEGQMNAAVSIQKMTQDLSFIEVKSLETSEAEQVYDFTVPGNHNFMAEGMIIHNTTFSDNLLAGAGMMSEEKAGKQLVLDFHEDEQERGITIDAANVSMVHEFEKKEYLINLIDTPGHVDFGGDVTRAMRAIDGTIVLVCAVEGVMPQTETVLRQALKERVKPVLFINKVDRLIRELKLTPEAMQERCLKIINHFNQLVNALADEEYKKAWQVSVNAGSVAFGSAFHNWAMSIPYMKRKGITFKEVIDAYESGSEDNIKALAKKAPLHLVVLDMSIRHHPTPVQAQKYRIPKIWHGDIESEIGKALISCDKNGPVGFVCTKIVFDKHAGEVAAGRLFSGTIRAGEDVNLLSVKTTAKIQQVSVYNGAKREAIGEAPAGNVIGLVGLKDISSGETVTTDAEMEPFEAIKHIFEPVVTKAIEAKRPSDLPKLVEVLRQVNKEDPTINIEINEETGEHLMTGMGELHLEVIENRIKTEKGVEIVTSNPIVVYRETITKKSEEAEGKSPNKHNKIYMIVEPLEESIYSAIKKGELPELRLRKKETEIWKKLEECGMDSKTARKVVDIYKGNLLMDMTRGVVHIGEVIDMIMDAFEDIMRNGTIAREPCTKLKVLLTDIKLHEDAIHRGPAQLLPAVRESMRGAMLQASPTIFEPLQIMQIEAPMDYMGELSKLIQNRRGQMLNMEQTGNMITIKAKVPVAESFGLTSALRSATEGRGSYYILDQLFEKLPFELQDKTAKQIRERKGLKLLEGVAMRA